MDYHQTVRMECVMHVSEVISAIGANNLVFDLDGTLIDSVPGIGTSLEAAFLSAGRQMPRTDLRGAIGPPIGIIARRLEPTLTDEEVAQIEQHYRKRYDTEGWSHTIAFDGVAGTLRTLHQQGLRLFVVTNKPRIPTKKILDYLNLQDLFDEVISRDSRTPVYASKTEMLLGLIDSQRLAPHSTVMLGDTAEDGEAAAANGLRFVHVSYGYGAAAFATHRIQHFSELLTLINGVPTSA
jgi:phosphoglycolate phosphatase